MFKKYIIIFLLLIMAGCTWYESEYQNISPLGDNADRGGVLMTEINWAGSYDNNGNYDPNDDFIEIQNITEQPINVSGWRFEVEGAVTETFIIPDNVNFIVYPDQYFTVGRTTNGAFPNLNTIISNFRLPHKDLKITLFTHANVLGEPIDDGEGYPLAGAEDGYTARSMERTQDFFDNEGASVSSWFTFNSTSSGTGVRSNYKNRTFASPGEANYSTF